VDGVLTMAQPPRYRIHPAIGIGRVGNAPAGTFFVGPEIPGRPVTGVADAGTRVPPFKAGGQVKRQAVRFRVWEYTEKNGVWSPSREIKLGETGVHKIIWTVHLANLKASFYKFDDLVGSPLLPVQPPHARRNSGKNRRERLEIDPRPRSIVGKGQRKAIRPGGSGNPGAERWPVPQPVPAIDSLGELRTDDCGRLIVVPGGAVVGSRGAPITGYANNDGWFDDTCDGPVDATVELRLRDGSVRTVKAQGAWMVVGPPDFAPDLPQTVSLYDLLFDLAAREMTLPGDESLYRSGELARLAAIAKDLQGGGTVLTTYKVSFDLDVAPILRQALASAWVFEDAQSAHTTLGAGSNLAAMWSALSDPAQPGAPRQSVVDRLRAPGTPGSTPGRPRPDNMPKILGDDPKARWGRDRLGLTLTVTQFAILRRWAAGAFTGSALPPSSLTRPPAGTTVTPHGLDRAALEHASGGSFYPGMEVGWQIREPAIFAEPFRIRAGAPSRYVGDPGGHTVTAGYFSRQMALPWVADFLMCKQEEQDKVTPAETWGWWPSQRPDSVYPTAAEAAVHGTMAPWHRATVGTSQDWPADPGEPSGRSSTMPSYQQMVDNWWKFGVVVETPGKGFAESGRSPNVP
jgi:hypothetical protein